MLLKQGKKDDLSFYVYSDREHMGKAAAGDTACAMRKLLAEKEEINMIFAAAPSQNEMLSALIAEKDLDWKRVNAFHMDEYAGLPQDAPQGFGNFLRRAIFDQVPFKSVHFICGSNKNTQEECERYSALLEKYPVDIVCLGIGENGHIAFNDPGTADFEDKKLVKEARLDQVCRNQQVHDGCFETLEQVPETALTLTIPALIRGTYMFCTVPAASKRWAVTETVTGKISENCPATIMRRHKNAYLYCDKESGFDLLEE